MDGHSGSDGCGTGRPGSVVAAHALLASSSQLLADRRALYRLAVQLADPGQEPSAAVLDHPISRYRIGEVIAGRQVPAHLRLARPDDLVDDATDCGLAVAGGPDSAEVLAPAVRSVAAEAGIAGGTLGLITRADGARYRAAVADLQGGLVRAHELVPDLLADLLVHVAVVGILDPQRSGTVVSASSRHVPGLVLLRPGGPLDIAEALIHEAAHQRLFDMAITRDLLRADADSQPGFPPSWRRVVWPVEQTLAAFHAYACLAELSRAVPDAERIASLGPHSVLPEAPERAAEIGGWLAEHVELLGVDAVRLVGALLGRTVSRPEPEALVGPPLPSGSTFRAQDCRVVALGDSRCLVGVPGPAPRLFWLDADASAVLEILRETGPVPVDRIVQQFRVGPRAGDAFRRVTGALDTLVNAELAATG